MRLQTVRSRCPDDPQPLHGLVNNAGGASALQYTTHRDLVAVLELNYRSVQRVSEAFAPLLAVGGRVAMVGSNMGPRFVQQCSEERRRFFSNPKVTADQLERLLAEIVAVSEVAAGESRREGETKCAEVESRAETVNVEMDAGEAEQGNLGAAAGFARLGLGSCGPYGLAKASVAVYASHLARAHPDLRINTCHPGQIETDLTRAFAHKFGLELAAMGLRTPREGATCVVHLIAEELEAPRGEAWFYGSDLQRSPLHRDRATGEPPYDGTLAEV